MFFSEQLLPWSVAVTLGLLLAIIIQYKIKNLRRNRLIDKLPGPKPHFLIGNALELLGNREDVLRKGLYLFEYPLCRLWIGPIPYVSVYDAEIVEAILSSPKLIDKGKSYRFLQPWLGLGLLTSTGKKWQTRRKMITPTFHFNILEEFRPVMNEQAEKLVSILLQHDGKEAFDVYPYCTRCTLDIICETAMGKNINAQDDVDSEYAQAVYMLTEILFKRGLMPWLYPDFVFNLTKDGQNHGRCLKIVHDFTNQIISERRKVLHEKMASSTSSLNSVDKKDTEIFGKKRRLAFLDMLLESSIDGQGLTDADIREEVDTFVFEGHDTTAVALNWVIYNIGLYPEIQKRVHEELDHIFGDSDRFVTNEDIVNLKFLDCVIKESLRLFPSVYLIIRQFKEDVNICGYTLPAGVDTCVFIYKLQRDPKHFPDPEKFDPDRFLAENAFKRHPYAYVPFSAGPRNCIGQKFAMMEEKVLLTHILRKFKVTTTQAVKDYKMLAELVLRPAGGTWIKIESRK